MQYNQCFIVHRSIIIKDTLTGTESLLICYYFILTITKVKLMRGGVAKGKKTLWG